FMTPTQRKLLTCLLLAPYAGISVLGQGLHWLSPDDGHHHDLNVIGCATHGHAHNHACVCHDHDSCGLVDADHENLPADKVISANDCVADSHVCEICEFLLHAIS